MNADPQAALTTPEAAMAFLFAGKAIVTIRSKKTGTRFTYRVRKARVLPGITPIYFVDVLNGSDNTHDYAFIGTIRNTMFCWSPKGGIGYEAPCVEAIRWTVDHFSKGIYPCTLEVWHEGRCGRCGRLLTVPESIQTGIGPECARRAAA